MVSLIEWSFRVPALRSRIFRMRRWPLRFSRGFLAEAVAVVRSDDDFVLLLKHESGSLHLPRLVVDRGRPIQLQAEAMLEELLQQPVSAVLVSAVGVVGDMTFLFRGSVPAALEVQGDGRWLTSDVAVAMLNPNDARLLALSG